MDGIFPIPLPPGKWTLGGEKHEEWGEGIIRSLNWLATGSFAVGKGVPTRQQIRLVDQLRENMKLFDYWSQCKIHDFDVASFWNHKHMNTYGEEVHVAQTVRWANVDESLPKAGVAGIVPAADLCTGGMRDFHFRPWTVAETWVPTGVDPPTKGHDSVRGLAWNGWRPPGKGNLWNNPRIKSLSGTRVSYFRRPIWGAQKWDQGRWNRHFEIDHGSSACKSKFSSLGWRSQHASSPESDVSARVAPAPRSYHFKMTRSIRAMFYIIGLPPVWYPYLCFERPVPRSFVPASSKENYLLHSKVLPMGYLNSVALSQHLHRQLVSRALKNHIATSHEIRRDRDFPRVDQYYRVYLDNFDSLFARSRNILEAGKPSLTELLQEEYLTMKVPRNEKKAVVNATAAEVQGAWIDGQSGVCSAKSSTVAKYLLGMLDVIQKRRASKKQLQMLAGGLVYLFSFRRCLMSCLNDIWKFIVGCQDDRKLVPLPRKVEEELIASFFLSSLAYMNFRSEVDPIVTASDASETGGDHPKYRAHNFRHSSLLRALVRGELPDNDPEGGIVVISAFDGVGSLRLALDLLNAPVAGYIAIERNPQARRVVESAFPSCIFIEDITTVGKAEVMSWAARFPNCAIGHICRRATLSRSVKFKLYKAWGRPWSALIPVSELCSLGQLVQTAFSWCPTYSLMEGVFSMSPKDRAGFSLGI